ncbi:non-homologous end-joining DNA ligase [Antarcticibacterium sp. 1MA-6-2]|uniref:non-homologous end-joining DNA ligase n=1 Tax=Antarcticibacterium sp. 1MA-6-2 TaxID=2908210 RepID=UPI001F21D69A|nr:non-homologous end-joining DNA ligase [Antarcticibacterium sp. 1MA-6-2]UJH90429.1 non-homologous end-joining DNA ligase [Antarcticibacterium sp. 1MA-6-2]
MKKVPEIIFEDLAEKTVREKQPEWISPMLAKLTHEEFSHKDWVYERKLDGERCLVFKDGKNVNIMSRNKKNLNSTYPEIIKALQGQPEDKFILDGEMVAFVGKHTSFAELQKRMHLTKAENIVGHKTKVFYYVFDIVHLNDMNLGDLPLLERKNFLQKYILFKDPVRFTEHKKEKGLKFLNDACRRKWEGLIAKKADSRYVHGRSSSWLKFKCTNEQEFVIGGFTEPTGGRVKFGALLLGYYDGDKFLYAGKVGTGFTNDVLEELHKNMLKREIANSKFANPKAIKSKNVHWLEPELVAQISFTEWTAGNKLRHPSFIGLRRDKDPYEVKKEA